MNKNYELLISESLILSVLKAKSDKNSDQTNYFELFVDFRTRVGKEMRFVVVAFPEYTPHDEEFHLKRLLKLADNILGQEVISGLNASELLVLCLGIYGHDWGMAVPNHERMVITGSSPLREESKSDFLKNEISRHEQYLKDAGDSSGTDDFLWQEYVRITHAERSSERVKKYFSQIDNGIGQAAAKACIGHWLDFRDLRDASLYPTSYIVKGESVNLRAITLYLRLIDLFDISNERTPYTIYKYTAPRSMRSKMEWAKHYAINSLTTIDYQRGRLIQVDGQTADYKVYAALEDLKHFCQEQLKVSNELFADMNQKFHLNIFDIKWNIDANGFDPISIKFEFDRKRMFEVLSDEIYQGDKYVFLRELLQNSIDAIKLRKELVEKSNGYTLGSFGEIHIEVSNFSDGDFTVTISDNGIGMDLYIIENYLSIAGKSYYTSNEFKKLGLSVDPISRFGVGILSCFMVADNIQIQTLRDKTLNNGSSLLTIDIPSVDQQFRIEATLDNLRQPGTTITINVSGHKFKTPANVSGKIQITEYIRRVAGYIEIPIFINEDGKRNVVINSNYPLLDAKGFNVVYAGIEPDYEDVFLPQSVRLAKENFKIQSVSFEDDLKLENIIGNISYFVPVDPFLKLRHGGTSWPSTEYTLVSENKRLQFRQIKYDRDWTGYNRRISIPENYAFGESSYAQKTFQVYIDGILVPKVDAPDSLEQFIPFEMSSPYLTNYFPDEFFIVGLVSVNFSKKYLKNISLSRTEIREEKAWDTYISTKLFDYLLNINLFQIQSPDLKERAFYIAQLGFIFNLPFKLVMERIGIDNCPVLSLGRGGLVRFELWGIFKDRKVYIQPAFSTWFSQSVRFACDEQREPKYNPLRDWKGDDFLVDYNIVGEDDNYQQYLSVQARSVCYYVSALLPLSHRFDKFRFIASPWNEGPPLIQQVWKPKDKDVLTEYPELIKIAALNIYEIDHEHLETLLFNLYNELSNEFDLFPAIGIFDSPFEDKVAYGVGWLNFLHPFTKRLLRILACIQTRELTKTNSVTWAAFIDKVMELPLFDPNGYYRSSISIEEINTVINEINEMVIGNSLIQQYEVLTEIDHNSFVDETVFEATDGLFYTFFKNGTSSDLALNDSYPDILS
jgi:hypothetical protein